MVTVKNESTTEPIVINGTFNIGPGMQGSMPIPGVSEADVSVECGSHKRSVTLGSDSVLSVVCGAEQRKDACVTTGPKNIWESNDNDKACPTRYYMDLTLIR